MPVLQIHALPQKNPERIPKALKDTCAAIAEAYECPIEHVWATWVEIKPGLYVEGRNSADIQPDATHPPIAQLICFEGKSPQQVEKVLLVAAKTLSDGLGISNNIFMTYVEAKSGHVVAGDGLIRNK